MSCVLFLSFLFLVLPNLSQSQSSPSSCPCSCAADDNFKTTNICAGMPSTCVITRCFPRTLGYGCCDEGTSEIGPPATPQDVVPLLESLINDVQEAVTLSPELSSDAADVLDQCIFDLEGLNSRVIPPEFVRDGTTARFFGGTLDVVRQMRSRAVNVFFSMINSSAIRVLQFVVSQLRRHLQAIS